MTVSDMELFGDKPGQLTQRQILASGETVLRALIAAGLRVPYGFDMDDGIQVWGVALADRPLALLLQAVTLWCSDAEAEFPSLAEFQTVVSAVEIEARQEQERMEGYDPTNLRSCDLCFETPGYIRDGPGRMDPLEPCKRCMPEKHRVWKSGHYNPKHRCWPECPGYVKGRRRRAS